MTPFLKIDSDDQIYIIRIAAIQHVVIHAGGIELHMDNSEVLYVRTKDADVINAVLKTLKQKEIV